MQNTPSATLYEQLWSNRKQSVLPLAFISQQKFCKSLLYKVQPAFGRSKRSFGRELELFHQFSLLFGNRHFDVLNTCICFFPGPQGPEELRTTKSVACVIKHHSALSKLSQLSNKCLIDKSDGIASHFFLDSIALSQAKLH